MGCPRFLWVPFELGRPFGAPHEPDFQRRVLLAALELLDRQDGPTILEDFPDDAPAVEGETVWSCPVRLAPQPDDADVTSTDAGGTRAEVAALQPWNEAADAEKTPMPSSGLTITEIVGWFEVLVEWGNLAPGQAKTVRLARDDLNRWYLDAARNQPGAATSEALNRWFWTETAVARLIGSVGATLLGTDDREARGLAARALVPRSHLKLLRVVEGD